MWETAAKKFGAWLVATFVAKSADLSVEILGAISVAIFEEAPGSTFAATGKVTVAVTGAVVTLEETSGGTESGSLAAAVFAVQ